MPAPLAVSRPSDLELLCPACAYDLRAAASDRCPECGLLIDRESLRTSAIPWARRQTIGRLRACFKTLWQITWDSKPLRHEHAREQTPSDAKTFSRITATLLALTFVGVFAALVASPDGYRSLAIERINPFARPVSDIPPWLYDVAVPWSAGAVLPTVLPICLTLLAFYMIAVPRPVFRVPTSGAAQTRAHALSLYVTAPLAVLPPGVACLLLAPWLEGRLIELGAYASTAWRLSLAVIVIGSALFIFSIVMTFVRAGQWVARARHAGPARAFLAVAELAGLWLIAAIVFVGLLPWCAGFVYILLDSLRH